ncbi:MAG: hypothetical protein ACI9H6_000407 [Patiriisocius sp.]|jgi:hypothetical protein
MLESSKLDRAKFSRTGLQNEFILQARNKASVSDIAKLCMCSERTIRTWQNEQFLMSYESVDKISKAYCLQFPKVTRLSRSDQNRTAGQLGGSRTIEKYGKVPVNESYRKEKRQQWWEEKGKHQKDSITSPRQVKFPKESKLLAEFCGIVLGDGGITNYQVTITLNLKTDKEYAVFVVALCKKLFGFEPSVYIRENNNTRTVVLSRVEIVKFLTESVGLVKGNKVAHQISIPQWILESELYKKACIRGLVDTDGSIFTHNYTSSGKVYAYKKLSFTSASQPLRSDVHTSLMTLGMKARLSGKFDVRLESVADVSTYFRLIGSSNPKHLKRYNK